MTAALDISANAWTFDLTDKRGRKQSLQMNGLMLWNEMPETKSFSGEGIYRTTVEVPAEHFVKNKKFRHCLDLGKVFACAKVLANGEETGDLWMQPDRIDVSDKLKSGRNQFEIRVVNLDWNYVKGGKNRRPFRPNSSRTLELIHSRRAHFPNCKTRPTTCRPVWVSR